jgi:hypothetical protein
MDFIQGFSRILSKVAIFQMLGRAAFESFGCRRLAMADLNIKTILPQIYLIR